MKNKFPKHLEKDMEKLYSRAIVTIGKKFLPQIKKAFNESINITDFTIKLNKIIDEDFVKYIGAATLPGIDKEIELVSAWAFSQTKKAVVNLQGLTAEQIREGILVNKKNPVYLTFVKKTIEKNKDLVKALGKEYIDGVSQNAIKTFIDGGSRKDLTNKMLEYTDENLNKAKFWARDQVGDAFAEFTAQQQSLSGIKNYIWRTMGDNAVRDDHAELEGRVFSWSDGAMSTGLLSKPGASHPAEDYSCRCYAEPTNEDVTG